jgi:hypothetical protein
MREDDVPHVRHTARHVEHRGLADAQVEVAPLVAGLEGISSAAEVRFQQHEAGILLGEARERVPEDLPVGELGILPEPGFGGGREIRAARLGFAHGVSPMDTSARRSCSGEKTA